MIFHSARMAVEVCVTLMSCHDGTTWVLLWGSEFELTWIRAEATICGRCQDKYERSFLVVGTESSWYTAIHYWVSDLNRRKIWPRLQGEGFVQHGKPSNLAVRPIKTSSQPAADKYYGVIGIHLNVQLGKQTCSCCMLTVKLQTTSINNP